MYFRLVASDYKDERWSSSNFGLQRTKDVVKALKWIERKDISQHNIDSIATAKLGAVVVGALGGKKARVSPADFLPFDTRKLQKETGITDESARVLRQLLKTRKMDGRVIGMLADEIKTASLRDSSE